MVALGLGAQCGRVPFETLLGIHWPLPVDKLGRVQVLGSWAAVSLWALCVKELRRGVCLPLTVYRCLCGPLTSLHSLPVPLTFPGVGAVGLTAAASLLVWPCDTNPGPWQCRALSSDLLCPLESFIDLKSNTWDPNKIKENLAPVGPSGGLASL